METIIRPVDRKLLEKELNNDRFIRDTNNADNKIYIVTNLIEVYFFYPKRILRKEMLGYEEKKNIIS